ncbi:MAG: STT3 domain-containing protein [Nanoarchaeota archaeon]
MSEEQKTESEDRLIEERKRKLKDFFVRKNYWVLIVLIIALILGIYIRSMPMQDHGGKPGLWDETTNDWTLGPDLDPFLFLRYAREMINGDFQSIDMMRNVPLGFDTSIELQMVSYMIVLTYKIINFFGYDNVNLAGVLMPVILFGLTIIVFFLFVREVFSRKGAEDKNKKANIIALISTFFMVVIPVFLSRTIAGIPEKESVAFFFMFLAFYLFLKAWKTERIRNSLILGVLAGIATALMGLSWGGVSYVYVTIAVSCFVAFVLNKFHKKETVVYSSWLLVALFSTLLFTNRFSLKGFLTGMDTGLAFLVLFALVVHFVIWKTKFSKLNIFENLKLPKSMVSIILAILAGIIMVSILVGPSFLIEKASAFNQIMFKPVTGRWSMTVAENRQPYFAEWGGSFGPFIKGIPIMFWLFFIGSIVLFKQMLSNLKKKDAWILTALYVLFFCGLVFSRYAPHPSIMDGEGIESRILYYGSALLIIGGFFYYYIKYNKENNKSLENIEFSFLFLFSLFVLCLFTARSAVRLIMVLGPVAPIFVAYLGVSSVERFRKTKDETGRVAIGLLAVLIIILALFSFYVFYKQVRSEAYNYIPNYYTIQWQNAMSWVRQNTSENAVFAHWWDYGYWVQSIGNRATVTDGGNAITYWNYLTGRFVLTGNNQKDALEFLYNHNATHLLIDPTDLGKYGAFSSIGSDANFDRLSYGPPAMISDPQTVQETKNGTLRTYTGTYGLEEDILINENDSRIFLPSQESAILGIRIEMFQNNNSVSMGQPQAVFYYQGRQIDIPLRYIYYNYQIYDFKSGIEGTAYITPRISQNSIDNLGVVMYLSPRLMRGLLAQIYILNDPFNNFPNFKIVHSEPNIFIDNINNQGYNVNEFAYIDGLGNTGPIKIWEIEYTGEEKIKQEYLDKDQSKYLDWEL